MRSRSAGRSAGRHRSRAPLVTLGPASVVSYSTNEPPNRAGVNLLGGTDRVCRVETETSAPPPHLVSVVIPVYQGERTLGPVVEELAPRSPTGPPRRVAATASPRSCSSTTTARTRSDDVMRDTRRAPTTWCAPVWLSRNFGQHAATLAGMASSGGEWVVTMDEDGQHDPAAIGALLDTAMREQADVVYAAPDQRAAARRRCATSPRAAPSGSSTGSPRAPTPAPSTATGSCSARSAAASRPTPAPGVYLDVATRLGRRPHRHLPGRAARRGRPALRLHPAPAALALLAAGALQRHPAAAAGSASSAPPSVLLGLPSSRWCSSSAGPAAAGRRRAGPRRWSCCWSPAASILFTPGRHRRVRRPGRQHGDGQAALPARARPARGPAGPGPRVTATGSRPLTWVVGSGGLVGRHVVAELTAAGHEVLTTAVPWADEEASVRALTDEVERFAQARAGRPVGARLVRGRRGRRHRGGGAGRRGARLRARDRRARGIRDSGGGGVVFLASSAGGLYAGSRARALRRAHRAATRSSPTAAPSSRWRRPCSGSLTDTGVRAVLGRLANVYGPGPDPRQAAGAALPAVPRRRDRPAAAGVRLDGHHPRLPVRG